MGIRTRDTQLSADAIVGPRPTSAEPGGFVWLYLPTGIIQGSREPVKRGTRNTE